MTQAAARPVGLSCGKLLGREVGMEFAEQEEAAANEKIEGKIVGFVNLEEGWEVE